MNDTDYDEVNEDEDEAALLRIGRAGFMLADRPPSELSAFAKLAFQFRDIKDVVDVVDPSRSRALARTRSAGSAVLHADHDDTRIAWSIEDNLLHGFVTSASDRADSTVVLALQGAKSPEPVALTLTDRGFEAPAPVGAYRFIVSIDETKWATRWSN